MILEEDAVLRTRITGALAPEGVNVLSFGRLAPAKEAARRANVDILVLGESIEGRLASDVALLAEWRNPRLGSILLSDRDPDAAEEVFDLIPSLQAVLGRDTGPRSLARVAIATARSQEGIVLLQGDGWRSGDTGAPEAEEDWRLQDVAPVHEAPQPVLGPVEDAPEPVWALPAVEEAPQPVWTATTPTEEPSWATPASLEEPAEPAWVPATPAEDSWEPVWAAPAPLEEAAAPVATQSAPVREALAPLRERLMQAQERLAALEMSAPVQELPARRTEESAPGLLYALPSFLRDDEDLLEARDDLAAPHPAMLPVHAAAPRRRLHLA